MAINLNPNTQYFTLEVGTYDGVTFTPTSEEQKVNYNQKCANYEVYLTWLNSFGAWEYWLFTAYKDYGYDISDSKTAKKNTFESWDNNFVNQETEDFYYFIEAKEQQLIRTQWLDEQTALNLSRIKYAIQVQLIKIDNSKVTVLVDKNGGFFKRDNRKGTEFSFTIKGTSTIPIQEQ